MNEYETTVGQATYKIQRQYQGQKDLTELLIDRMLQAQLPATGFDTPPATDL